MENNKVTLFQFDEDYDSNRLHVPLTILDPVYIQEKSSLYYGWLHGQGYPTTIMGHQTPILGVNNLSIKALKHITR